MSRTRLPKETCPHCHQLYLPPVVLTCANEACGKSFTRMPGEIEKHNRKLGPDAPHYCCRDCGVAGRVGKRHKSAVVPNTDSQKQWDEYLSAVGLGVGAGTNGGRELQHPAMEALQ